MAAQDLQEGRDTRTAIATSHKEDLSKQREILEEREDELLAAHPGKFIVVCGGDVFVGDSGEEAVSRAEAAHPGRPFFLRMHYPDYGQARDDYGNERVVDAAAEEDLARQEAFYEAHEDELLAAHPGKVIAVCGEEVFVGADDAEAVSKAEAAHPGRQILLSGQEIFCGGW